MFTFKLRTLCVDSNTIYQRFSISSTNTPLPGPAELTAPVVKAVPHLDTLLYLLVQRYI